MPTIETLTLISMAAVIWFLHDIRDQLKTIDDLLSELRQSNHELRFLREEIERNPQR